MTTAAAPVETRTLHGVALVKVGKWGASKGDGNITAEELAAMVEAAKDPAADRAPIKLGHADTRFEDAGSGEPAYGWVEKLRLSDDGQTLIGDLAGIPARLADVMPNGWRNRSIEMVRNDGTHKARLTGLALLGATAPAVKGLDDVLALYSAAALPDEAWLEMSGDTPPVPPAIPASPDGGAVTSSSTKGAAMAKLTDDPKLREAFGLAENATEEQVTEALTKNGLAVITAAPAEPATLPAPAAPADPAAPVATAASAAPVTQVDAAALSALQAENAAMKVQLSGLVANEDKKRRDDILGQATRAGKVHPTVAAHYRKMLDTNEAETTALLSALPAVMPVQELGHSFSAAPAEDEQAARIEAAKVAYLPGYKTKTGA